MHKVKPIYLLWLLLFLASSAQSEETFYSVQYENDLFSADNRDRYYTSGMQLSLLKKKTPPALLKAISQRFPFYQNRSDLNWVQYTFGQKMFTPEDTQAIDIQESDRPYAGYLYFKGTVMANISQGADYDYGNQFEVTFGLVGPSALGEQAQTTIHEWIGSAIPNGWDNQLKDELALGLSYSRFWRLIRPLSNGLEFGINPQVSAALGNVYTYGSVGTMLRLGTNLRRDLSPPNISPGFPGIIYFEGAKQSSWYAYLGFEGRLVYRNIFLDGNSFVDSHSVEKENSVGDVQYGVVYMFDDIRIAYSSMIRTAEFTTQNAVGHYGSINISLRY
ncbi:MAG: lipid A 3-O-deacylase [Thiomicrorhabdus sp.]|nr:MAG: lipid A 3-O-deacylase [Thiomicrorhabdus sp.]